MPLPKHRYRLTPFGISAMLLSALLAMSVNAALAESWQGLMVVSQDANAQQGVIPPEEVCEFASIRFNGQVESGAFVIPIDHNGRRHTFEGDVSPDGKVGEWGNMRINHQRVPMKLEGRFSDTAFVGRVYGRFHNIDMRAPGDWYCRADVFMARSPLTPEVVRQTHNRIDPSASEAEVLAALETTTTAKTEPTPPSTLAPVAPPQAESIPHAAPAPQTPTDPALATLRDQLGFLMELRDGGLIDEKEFERRSRALLDRQFGETTQPEPSIPFLAPNHEIPIEVASGPDSAPNLGDTTAGARSLTTTIDWGTYHALVIGINDYEHLPKLETAINDALRVADLLERLYGFQVEKLINPSRQKIVDALDRLRENLRGNDNLLIYYAGHGWLDEEAGRGYWLPADAQSNRRGNWVSNATITDTLKTLLAKHVMIVADSCFSGSLTRAAPVALRGSDYWHKIANKAARVTLTSGGVEPVADNNGSGHSPFAAAFIDALEENQNVIDGTSLFTAMRRPVMLNANQTPEYSDVREAGHDGGDFVFVRKH